MPRTAVDTLCARFHELIDQADQAAVDEADAIRDLLTPLLYHHANEVTAAMKRRQAPEGAACCAELVKAFNAAFPE